MAAPQLRLEVSLNLAGFRTEVQKLTNIAQSEFTPKINVKFNRQTLDTELNNLQAAIKRRVYRVEIGGNIDALPDKIKALKEQLSSLESFKIDLGVGAVKSLSKKDANKIATDLRAQIAGEQKKIYVGVGATAELTGEEARKVVANLRAQIVGEKKKIVVGVGAIKALSNEDAQAISAAISAQVAGKKGAVLIPASIVTSITGDDVAAFKSTVKEKLSGIKIKVGIEAQVPGAGTGATPASGERKRSAGYEAALQSISGLQVEQLRRRAFSSLGEESRTAQQVSNWLNTIVSEGLQGKAKTSQLTAVREFLADALATAAGRNIEARMQPLRGQTSIEAARSATNINKILDPIAQYTQKPEAAQQMLRMLPENRISTNTLDIASKQARYYESIPGAESFQSEIKGFDPLLKSIAKDFTEYTKSLSPTNPWIGKISDGIANMVSSAAVPLQTQKLLPAAGQSNASRMTRSLFAGLPPIQAPSIGQENAPLSAGATRSLNKARQLLGMPIGPVSSYVSNPWAGSATVPPVTTASPSRGLPVAGSLPPAGATSNYGVAAQAQAMAQATQRFGFMRAPSMPPSLVRPSSGGPPTPPIPPRGGGGGGGGFFGGMQFNMPQLPGAGLVREIGEQFGFAAKQVLLYGTAYKALGLLQAFPAQVGDAVGALQSFRNTLNAISPTAQEAAASSEFILNIVDKYNVPLQSARDGFTKLYASMAPTGFSGNEIRDLFTGISQAAATFGMSSDKVDRVTYAFAQMASKGQVMSEELKGQLGDVLPGAMGIFAKAAGFEGADAIQKFGKALEDGAYKGKPMRDLLKNVTIELKKEFGPGAEGAARTYQGVMTRMANSTRLFYETFEPVAVGFLNSVVMPITSGIKTVTDGFNAFFTGQAAKTAGGNALAKQLTDLKPAFDGILLNIQSLLPSFQAFGSLTLNVAKLLTALAGNPVVGFLLQVYTNVLLVNTAFTLLGGRILLGLIAKIGTALIPLIAFNAQMNAIAIASGRAGTSITGVGLQMQFLRAQAISAAAPVNALLGSLLSMAKIGAIAIVLTIVVNGLTQMKEAEDRLARLRGEKDPVGPSGPKPVATAARRYTGSTREKVIADQQKQQDFVADLRSQLKGAEETLRAAQATAAVSSAGGRILQRTASANVEALKIKIKDAEDVLNLDPKRYPTQAERDRTSVTATSSATAGTGTGTKGKPEKERESQIPQLTLALEKTKELSGIEMQIVNAQLMNNTAQLSALELAKQLVNFKYEEKELELQKLTAAEQAIAKKEIGLRREQAIVASQLQLQIDFRKEREAVQEGFVAILAGYDEEFKYQQMYLSLIDQGIRPSLAKARVEVEKTFNAQEKTLDTLIDQNKENIAGLEVDIERFKLKKELSPIEKDQLKDAEARLKAAQDELAVRMGLKAVVPETKSAAMQKVEQGLAPKTSAEYMGEGLESAEDKLAELTNTGYQVVQAANAIGDAFGEAFKGVITGSMTAREALAGMFQSVADHFADMVAQMIAEYLKMALIKGIMSIIGGVAGGLGGGVGGSFADSAGGAAGFGGSFDSGIAPLPSIPSYSGAFKTAANGAVWTGGFQAFANGGIVTGPTLGLVGEGRYNEAVIPLPDGKSVPVQLSGGDGGNQINSNITVNVSNGQAQSNATGSNSSELGRKIEGAVKQVIVGELRPGGLLASR